MSLSPNTVASRVTELAEDVQTQLIKMTQSFQAFSIALDESTDVSDTAQCAFLLEALMTV